MEIAVIAPPACSGVDIPLAAAHAGEIALLDFTSASQIVAFDAQFSQLRDALDEGFGVRVDQRLAGRLAGFLAKREIEIDLLIVCSVCGDLDDPAASVAQLRQHCRRLFFEVVSLDEAQQAQQAGADGVVAKGNEAGGRVGSETAFILLQRLCPSLTVPVWVQGGVGPRALAACRVAGARGVLLDTQLGLAEESTLREPLRSFLMAMDGTETVCLGEALDMRFRVHKLLGRDAIASLREVESAGDDRDAFIARLRVVLEHGGGEALCPIGQEAAFAAPLAAHHRTVAGILRAYRRQLSDGLRLASEAAPFAENSPFAEAHGTRFPIVQGPMTRVSDVAGFAGAVADHGALPFLALALLRGPDAETLLRDTADRLGSQPWGVGILGFVSAELRAEQLDAVKKIRPRYAILAGGRPDQAAVLEEAGIATYIHVPSARLLDMFLRAGSRRFVFEGRECGGHIGPLSSAMLWSAALDVLLEFQGRSSKPETIDVFFAGGIHDAVSAAMVGAFAAGVAASNIRIGVLMGTAYLFTGEAVETGAILAPFQEEALACTDTVILDADGGHAIRCARTPYADEFKALKRGLLKSGASASEVRRQLEEANLGRLRLASKGVGYAAAGGTPAARLTAAAPEEQKLRGMYMLGQVAALRAEPYTMAALHQDAAQGSTEVLRRVFAEMQVESGRRTRAAAVCGTPEPIAIVGMACLFPKAGGVAQFWDNTLNRLDAIQEVPADRWQVDRFYSERADAPDRVISKWGGFIDSVHFDPVRYGIPPASVGSIEPLQLLFLDVVRRALEDSGYDKRPFDRERAAVVVGTGGPPCDLAGAYEARALIEHYLGQVDEIDPDVREKVLTALRRNLPQLTEDSFPGILPNVMAGRVANRFDLGGPNIAIDAACGSSLAALDAAVKELRQGTSDLAVVGGADGQQNIHGYLLFSKTRALSPRGRCRPFDAQADGIAISDGVAAIIVKRLGDAQRDGDRIYSVIRNVAGSSDGRDKSLTAPSVKGQRRAVKRAYAGLEFSPAAVGLVEAHGTGTIAGDRAELETLRQVFQEAQAAPQSCALGSVKSLIGHTKNAAGLAGLIKTTLALHHRTLPPTLFEEPSPAARDRSIPFYLSGKARPWLHSAPTPRRAGVSAFGFGGTNFHAVLEEYPGHCAALPSRPAELLVFRAASRTALADEVDALRQTLSAGGAPRPMEIAATLLRRERKASGDCRLGLVAGDPAEMQTLLGSAAARLRADGPMPATGPILFGQGAAAAGATAFLFPGQGSQRIDMISQLALYFPIVRACFERADRILSEVLPTSLMKAIFPPPAYTAEEEAEQHKALEQTWFTQPALGAADYAVFKLLDELGIQPDILAGHSYGEYVALCVAGTLSFYDLIRLSELRGRVVQETQGRGAVAMLAISESREKVETFLAGSPGVTIATINAPKQITVGGGVKAIEAFAERLQAASIRCSRLPMSAGFHIPEAFPAAALFARAATLVKFQSPRLPVYSGLTAQPYPAEANAMRRILIEQLTKPVRFLDQIEAMYAAGVRTFIEVGPGQVLSSLTRQTLAGRPAQLLTTDRAGAANPLADFLGVVGQLFVAGAQPRLERLFAGSTLHGAAIEVASTNAVPSATTWLVDSGRSRPLRATQAVAAAPRQQPASADKKPPSVVMPAAAPARAPLVAAAPAQPLAPPARAPSPTPAPRPIPASIPAMAHGAATAMDGAASFRVMLEEFRALQSAAQREREEVLEKLLAAMLPAAATPPAASIPVLAVPKPAMPKPAMPKPAAAKPEAAKPAIPPLAVPKPAMPAAVSHAMPVPVHAKLPVSAVAVSAVAVSQMLLELVSERTGYPVEMLVLEHDMEADLGIDSIKRTEIFGALRELLDRDGQAVAADAFFLKTATLRRLRDVIDWLQSPPPSTPTPAPTPVQPAAEPARLAVVATTRVSMADVTLELVSARTGYPVEMLDLDHDLEADLGIDSIKRTEIFGALHERLGAEQQAEDFFVQTARLRTLRHVLNWLEARHEPVGTVMSPPPLAPTLEPALPQAATTPVAIAPVAAPQPADPTELLVALVSERTGYPVEMLDLDHDLEADLGIDSIKRTEIFGALHERLGAERQAEDFFVQTSRLRTLRHVLDWLKTQRDPAPAAMAPAPRAPVVPAAPALPPATIAAAAVAPAPRPPAPPQADPTELLIALVSERTGYPVEMLQLDHNLEADLGIDSIKRTEILGALRERLSDGNFAHVTAEAFFRATGPLRSLRELATWLRANDVAAPSGGAQSGGTPAPSSHATTIVDPLVNIRRYLVQAQVSEVEVPSDLQVMFHRSPELTPGAMDISQLPLRRWGVLLITEDAGGRAQQLAEALRGAEMPPPIALVRHGPDLRVGSHGNYEADLLSPDCVKRLRETIQKQLGTVTDLWHLLPSVAGENEGDAIEVRSLFVLASVFGGDLQQARGTLGAVTAMGGTLGFDATPAGFSPGQAGVSGLVKSLVQEWPEVFVRCRDFDPSASESVIQAQAWSELGGWDPTIETGYSTRGRCVVASVETALDRGGRPRIELDRDCVILVTGGARGIGAHVCAKLAAQYGCRTIMTGRTAHPVAESPATASLADAAALKRALAQLRRDRGAALSPLLVEADYQALLRDREMLAGFARLEALGAPFDYHCLDVCNADALEALVASIYRKHGRIDGVIHAAGVAEDGLVLNKPLESFDRVFTTKVSPALTLARVLRPDGVRFMAFFSSVAARYGCAGGADYAAANEVLNKLAWRLNAEWSGRVVAIGWGPWAESGMATRYSGELHEGRGFDWLPIDAGCQRFVDEIAYGHKNDAEVLIFAELGDGPEALAAAQAEAAYVVA